VTSRLAAIDDTIIARIEQVMDGRVRTIDYAPPDWDIDYLKRVLISLPGVFLSFSGGTAIENHNHAAMRAEWDVVAVVKHVQTARQRARGDATEIGCLEILEAILPALNGLTIFVGGQMIDANAIGTLRFVGWSNDQSLQFDKHAVMIQSLRFSMDIAFESTPDASLLVPFERFVAEYDIGQPDGAPETIDHVELPQ
jgi:hypothetical protein